MSARLVSLIEVQAHRGEGTTRNPHRIVREYWTAEGEKVAEFDPSGLVPGEVPMGGDCAHGVDEEGRCKRCGIQRAVAP